jgi:hypothetical protein
MDQRYVNFFSSSLVANVVHHAIYDLSHQLPIIQSLLALSQMILITHVF